MTNTSLAQSYLQKATSRLKILTVLLGDAAYSDVVREAQELDFIPTEQYTETDALRAMDDAQFVVSVAGSVIPSMRMGR